MMKMRMLAFGFLFTMGVCSAQTQSMSIHKENNSKVPDSIVNHKVQMGETIMMIARKYHTTPRDIYNMNPTAVDGISYNMTLTIPAEKIVRRERKIIPAGAQAYNAE